MKSSWIRVVALGVFFVALGSACRESARQPAQKSAAPARIASSAPSGDPLDCAALRTQTERWLADLSGLLVVDDLDDAVDFGADSQDPAGAADPGKAPPRDPRPPKYADKLAALLQKAALCERGKGGTWFIRYAQTELLAQPPGDVIVPWSLVHVGADGKSVEIASDPEDSSSASFVTTQHEANKGAPPQRPRFIAAVGAKFYVAERSREDGQLSLPESLLLFDYDGDGEAEAILTEHSNSLGRQERTVTVWSAKGGRIVPYAPAWQRMAEAARDVDGDGRPDLLYRPYWGEKGPGGAELALLHSLGNGSFSTSDAAVAAFHDKQPPPLPIRPDAFVEKRDAKTPPPLLRSVQRPPTAMLCKREYERMRALLVGAPSYFGRQHVPRARAAAEGLASLLRKRSFCVPAQHGAWAVSFVGYQFGGEGDQPAHSLVAKWSLVHLGLDGTRVRYEVPPHPIETPKSEVMLPLDDLSSLSFAYYTDDPLAKQECHHGYDLPSSLRVVDYDQKGEEEVIFETTSEERQCNSEKFYLDPVAILTLRDGKVVPYDAKWHLRFDNLEDLDRDGRPDLLYRPYRALANLQESCPDSRDGALHDPFVHGPLLVAHALPQGGFSATDQMAKDYVRSFCPQRPKAAAKGDAQLCARLWGVPAKTVLRDAYGERLCVGCEDCVNRRRMQTLLDLPPPLHLP